MRVVFILLFSLLVSFQQITDNLKCLRHAVKNADYRVDRLIGNWFNEKEADNGISYSEEKGENERNLQKKKEKKKKKNKKKKDKDKKKKKKKKKNNGNGNNGRQKGWVYSGKNGQVRINSNEWTDYDDNEIGRGRGDAADKLRSWDACLKNGDYNRNNCLKPPNCGGGEKLCINRAQRSNNDKKSYVKVMKCIPGWENCDKCLCGRIKSTKCDWKGGSPDDDRWKIASCKKKVFELKNNVI
eukprot:CAMPEP_0195517178 /NCGR_PEP_ID=MMETSP0794_2-20130614/10225_1 /TAXON_ID=515487 /ORGANISM="Stephanopyxis turris, Strain CCMP 815" /LENGTH=240 /DNA_ID=CAMNT_0040645947 /DNA_START=165 /DNA_END=887 /DNA_ORIENTATION=+